MAKNVVNSPKPTAKTGSVSQIRQTAGKTGSKQDLELADLQFRNALDHLLQGVCIINKDSTVRFVNCFLAGLLGVNREDCAGKYCAEVFSGSLCNLPGYFLSGIKGGKAPIEIEIETSGHGGRKRLFIVNALPLTGPSDEPVGIMGLFDEKAGNRKLQSVAEASGKTGLVQEEERINDKFMAEKESGCKQSKVCLTSESNRSLENINNELKQEILKRQELEKELEEQKAHLQYLLDTIPAGIFILDHEARFTYINKAGVRAFCKPLEELIGKTGHEIFPDRESAYEAYQDDLKVIRTGQYSRVTFYEPLVSNWFQMDRYPYKDADGKILGELSIEVDVNERIAIEERLKELLSNERILREQIEAQNNQRIEFTRAMVHEIKTPLTSLILASEVLMKQQEDKDSAKTAQVVYVGALALNKRVDELVDLAKGEIGRLELNCGKHNLAVTLKEVCSYMEYSFNSKKQVFNYNFVDNIPVVMDEQRTRQILLNLLDNACKYTPRKGVISLTTGKNADTVEVIIADNGLGIAESEIDNIFKLYYGLKTGKQSHRGLGIGLSLSKMLAELQGGTIAVTSSEGKGSVFKLILPCKGGENETAGY